MLGRGAADVKPPIALQKELLGRRVRAVRAARKLSLAVVAAFVGVSKMAVSKWERGEAAPENANLARLAEALGVEIRWLGDKRPIDGAEVRRLLPARAPGDFLTEAEHAAAREAAARRAALLVRPRRPAHVETRFVAPCRVCGTTNGVLFGVCSPCMAGRPV
jgi:transcriptional regulator with XRE-family HTH domain